MRPDQIEAKHEVEARCCVSCMWVADPLVPPQNQTCAKWVGPTRVFDPIFGYRDRKGFGHVPLVLQRAVGGACGPTGTGWEIGPTHDRIMRSIEAESIGRDVQP